MHHLGESPLPTSSYDVALYVTHVRHNEKIKSTTLRSRLSAIAYYHKINSHNNPTKDFIMSKLVKSHAKKDNLFPSRKGISFKLLTKMVTILSSVSTSHYDSLLFRVIFTFTYHAALSSSEICFSGNFNHQLLRNRVKLSSTAGDQHVKLSLLSYKHSKGTPLPIILKARDDCTCPFQAAKAYLKKRKSKVQEFICHENGKHVTRSQIAGKLQLTLQVLGKRPASYNTHSFRIGKISDMATSGSSQPQLKMTGRWKSNNAHQPYIKPSAVKL